MNGELPDSVQVVGLTIGGVVLAAALVALGVNGHGCESVAGTAVSFARGLGHEQGSIGAGGVAGVPSAPSSGEVGDENQEDRGRPRATYTVEGAVMLNIRDAAPQYQGGRRRLGRDVGDLTRGTVVWRLSEIALGDGTDVWYQVEVIDGPSTGLRGWVSARFLQQARR